MINQEAEKCLEVAAGKILRKYRKVVTGRTIRSLETESERGPTSHSVDLYADKSWLFIEKGKRANTKLPVIGGTFELVPELKAWKAAVGFGGSDYMLARAIARKPRKGIPLTDDLLREVSPKLEEVYADFVDDQIFDYTVSRVKRMFQ